jgi:hypothetical protein
MEKSQRHLRLVHSQAESEVVKAANPFERARSLARFIKKLVGITPVREAPIRPEVESFRAMRQEENDWMTGGNSRYW